jgi:feruloyl esterase
MRQLISLAGALSCAALLHAQTAAMDAAACERLAASLDLPNAKVTLAQPVTSHRFVPPGTPGASAPPAALTDLPAFCRVTLTLTPSSDSDITSEVWLPLAGWNGKFQQVGNGGWGGSIQYAALASALRRGYAAASTDTGHVGDTAQFAVGHPEKLIDFGYRAVHETAVQSKAIVAAAYATAPRFSYFVGCSGGGRQAFMEAQRYPQDFDGIVAGAPGYNRTDQSFQLVAASQATHRDAASFIPPEKLAVLHRAALSACDQRDGLIDGLISDPMGCKVDVSVTACTGTDGPGCLTAPQVRAAKAIYEPIVNPRTGEEVFPGVEPGSEPRWTVNAGGARPLGMSDDFFKFVVFQDPGWDFRTLDVANHLEQARKADGGIVSATSPDIRPFVSRGGKLVIYHGWGDTNVPPRSSVNYYKRLVETLGASDTDRSVRLYMAPGMGHCGGGEGPNTFDALTALEQWREEGNAPAEILASQLADGRVVRARPLCPYPQIARYKGSGSIDEASNFVCRVP